MLKIESPFHALCECDNYSAQEFEYLGYHCINSWEVDNIHCKTFGVTLLRDYGGSKCCLRNHGVTLHRKTE